MRSKTYRRFRTEFKLGIVEAYIAAEVSLKSLATKAGVDHSLVHYWLKEYHAGELSLDLLREEQLVETEQHIAALERKVGVQARGVTPDSEQFHAGAKIARAPRGDYVVRQYHAVYSQTKAMVETLTLTLTRAGDGVWRVGGYFIR